MKIGFLRADVITGGQYQALYYNNIIIPDRRPERIGNYFGVVIDDDEFGYVWYAGNYANIKWEALAVFVEVPVAYKTVNVPSWLPNYQKFDENGDPQPQTFEEWGGVVAESLDNTQIILKMTQYGDFNVSQMDDLESFLAGEPLATGLLVDETRTLKDGPGYTA